MPGSGFHQIAQTADDFAAYPDFGGMDLGFHRRACKKNKADMK